MIDFWLSSFLDWVYSIFGGYTGFKLKNEGFWGSWVKLAKKFCLFYTGVFIVDYFGYSNGKGVALFPNNFDGGSRNIFFVIYSLPLLLTYYGALIRSNLNKPGFDLFYS